MMGNRVGVGDIEYPELLRGIADPPQVLHYKGDISILNENKCVAVVGSRATSSENLQAAEKFGMICAEEGYVVVNGLALGCDTYALKGALKANGKCVVVLPSGIDSVYPKENKDLADRILDSGGCIISEYPGEQEPQKYQFVRRDRLQSGLSRGVFVVTCGKTSGTLHTVDYALKQGRTVGCYAYEKCYEEGNLDIQRNGIAQVVRDEEEFAEFLRCLPGIDVYEQMTMKFE